MNTSNSVNAIDLDVWRENNIDPILFDIDRELGAIQSDDTLHLSSAWWFSFKKNTAALFEIWNKKDCNNQITMTLRLLMEISADVSFISKNPKNVSRINKLLKRHSRRRKSKKYSYNKAAKDAHRFYLFEYRKYGKKRRTTSERVKAEYSDVPQMTEMYAYYSAYSHFNPLGILWDIEQFFSNDQDKLLLEQRKFITGFYPIMFKKMVLALGELNRSEALIDFNFSRLENIFTEIQSSWQTE